jgi:tetratricopeptide (TPR) repeat protein
MIRERLEDSYRRARQGEGGLLALIGPSGVGKWELLSGTVDRLGIPSSQIVHVRVARDDLGRPFQALSPMIERVLSGEGSRPIDLQSSLFLMPFAPVPSDRRTPPRSPGIDPPALGAVASLVPGWDDYRQLKRELEFYKRGVEAWGDRTRFLHEVGDLLVSYARSHGGLWLIENAHYLDPHSWSLLRYLGDRVGTCPLAIWLTLDVETVSDLEPVPRSVLSGPGAQVLPVPRLSRDETEERLRVWIPPSQVTPELVESLWVRSQGLPLTLEQLVRGEDWKPGSLADRATSPDPLKARLEAFPLEDRERLRRLSVLGRTFPFVLARILLELPELACAEKLERLVKEGFLREASGEAYSFLPGALGDQLRQELDPERRRELHGKVARALEESGASHSARDIYWLADHWFAAEEWERAWESNLRACRTALDTYAPDLALTYADRALKTLDHLPDAPSERRGEALVERGRALHDLTRLSEAEDTLRQALRIIPAAPSTTALRARALFHLARTLGSRGRGEETFPLVQEARQMFEVARDRPGELMLHQVVGVSLMMTGRASEAAQHFREMLRIAQDMKNEREISYAKKNLSAVLLMIDPRDAEGLRLVDEALAYHERTRNYAGLAAGYLNRGINWLALEAPDRALEDFRRSREAAMKARAPLLASSAALSEADLLISRGAWGPAEGALRSVEPLSGALEGRERIVYPLLQGRIREGRHDEEGAIAFYTRALVEAQIFEDREALWESHLGLARALRRKGDLHAAQIHRESIPSEDQVRQVSEGLAAQLHAYDTAD